MKILLIAITKNSASYIDEGVSEFSKRIKRYTDFEVKLIAPKEYSAKLPIEDIQKAETGQFLKAIPPQSTVILLDELGKTMNSKQFSAFLEAKRNDSTRNLVFGIGGSYGWHSSLKADFPLIRLSDLTFPHHLARLVLLEQIYRAFTILNNQEYHH